MIKALYVLSVLALSSAGVLLAFSISQWLQAAESQEGLGPAAAQWSPAWYDAGGKNAQETAVPLLREAEAFALYLNPPAPPAAPALLRATPRSKVAAPRAVPQSSQAAPWFCVLATSYNHRHPEQSWALISEPGRKDRWVTSGEPLGHFVLESVQKGGSIMYRDGNQAREMRVALRQVSSVARLQSDVPASAQGLPLPGRLVNVSPPGDGGVGIPDIEALAQELR